MLTLFLVAVLVTGVLAINLVSSEVYASGQGKGNDNGKGKSGHAEEGCETATAASEGKTKNPHCDDDGDGVSNANDVCPGFDDNADADNDGIPDGCDLDIDGDGFPNSQEIALGTDPNDPADFPGCGGSNTVDFCIDGDGIATPGRGTFTALWGDVLSTWPAFDITNPQGIDAMKTLPGVWVIGISDLHTEDVNICPGALRNAVHDLGVDCKILDLNGDLVNLEPVSCDFEFAIPFTGCPPFAGPNSVKWIDTGSNAWDNGEDIILDVNGNGIFD